MFDDDRVKEQYGRLQHRMDDLHRRLRDKARERGSNDGGRLMLAVEGTGDQTLQALRAIWEAGVPIDFANITGGKDHNKEWLQARTGIKANDMAPLHKAVDELQRGFEDVHRTFAERYALPTREQQSAVRELGAMLRRAKDEAVKTWKPSAVPQEELVHQKIATLYDQLLSMVEVLDDPETHNAKEQLPFVAAFTEAIAESLGAVHRIYLDHLAQTGTARSNEVWATEREGHRMFEQFRVFIEAMKTIAPGLTFAPATHEGLSENYPTHTDSSKQFYNDLRTRKASSQEASYAEAERLGKHHGASTLYNFEGVILGVVDMLRQLKKAGVNINMNAFPDARARFEFYGLEAPVDHTAFNASRTGPQAPLAPVDPVVAGRKKLLDNP